MTHSLPISGVIGEPASSDDAAVIHKAISQAITIINGVPDHLRVNVITSIFTTLCCNQPDPAGTFDYLSTTVGGFVHVFQNEVRGRG